MPPAEDEAPIRLGPLRLDLAARRAEVHGAEVVLAEREFDLLAALASDPGRVFTKEKLLRDVWGRPDRSAIRTLDSHASKTRIKLREAGAEGSSSTTGGSATGWRTVGGGGGNRLWLAGPCGPLRYLSRSRAILSAASTDISCSQTLTTAQPAALSSASLSRSRSTFRAIFALQ